MTGEFFLEKNFSPVEQRSPCPREAKMKLNTADQISWNQIKSDEFELKSNTATAID